MEKLCPLGVDGKTCIKSLLEEARQVANSSTTPGNSFPWWFITMMRDIHAFPPVHGAWHNLTIIDPPMDYCTIEKIASTQWRNVQCFLNENKKPIKNPKPCQLNQTVLATRNPREVSRAVMLRDPLERLLSAYLNKCANDYRRSVEKHCEPKAVFNPEANEPDMTVQLREDPRQLFAAYVDAFPLQWNLHFFPQSMHCDLIFRHVKDYDFVGKMDKDFYIHLQQFSTKFGNGNELPVAMEKVFDLSRHVGDGSNVGKETRAPDHVYEYYTPASLRRALEYFAVDYLMLGLEVPGWVHEILAQEDELFKI